MQLQICIPFWNTYFSKYFSCLLVLQEAQLFDCLMNCWLNYVPIILGKLGQYYEWYIGDTGKLQVDHKSEHGQLVIMEVLVHRLMSLAAYMPVSWSLIWTVKDHLNIHRCLTQALLVHSSDLLPAMPSFWKSLMLLYIGLMLPTL